MKIGTTYHKLETDSLKCPTNAGVVVEKNACYVIEGWGQIYMTPRSNICQENGKPEGGGVWNPGSYISLFFDRSIGINMHLISSIDYFSSFKAVICNVLTYLSIQRKNRIREMSLTGLFVLHIGNPGSYPRLVAWQVSCCLAVSPVNRLKITRNDLLSDYKLEGATTNFFTSF